MSPVYCIDCRKPRSYGSGSRCRVCYREKTQRAKLMKETLTSLCAFDRYIRDRSNTKRNPYIKDDDAMFGAISLDAILKKDKRQRRWLSFITDRRQKTPLEILIEAEENELAHNPKREPAVDAIASYPSFEPAAIRARH